MKLDPGMHIGMHLVSFGKSGVTAYYLSFGIPTTTSSIFFSSQEKKMPLAFGWRQKPVPSFRGLQVDFSSIPPIRKCAVTFRSHSQAQQQTTRELSCPRVEKK
jgi:hypothetical protein